MIKIKFIGRYRGFLNDLFSSKSSKIEFNFNTNSEFEVIKSNRLILSKIFNSTLLDFLGLFTTLKYTNDTENEVNYLLSYNRFIKGQKKYVVILENPTALVNYSDTKMFSYFAKKRLDKLFSDKRLVKIVCMSKICETSFPIFYTNVDASKKIEQIYPLVNNNNKINEETISSSSKRKIIKTLYISSNFTLKGGEDILSVFERFEKESIDVTLNIITKIDTLHRNVIERVEKLKNVNIIDFSLNRNELIKYYEDSDILLNPTRMDSFSLVTLEAIKNGCAVIGSDVYAIKEMVHEGKNGYLLEPKYKYWNEDGSINHYVKKHPSKTYNSEYLDDNMVSFIYEKLVGLNNDREKLKNFRVYSHRLSKNKEFNEIVIKEKWESIFTNIN